MMLKKLFVFEFIRDSFVENEVHYPEEAASQPCLKKRNCVLCYTYLLLNYILSCFNNFGKIQSTFRKSRLCLKHNFTSEQHIFPAKKRAPPAQPSTRQPSPHLLCSLDLSQLVAEEIDKNQKIAARKPSRNSAPSFVLESFSFVCFPVGLIFNISFHIVGRLSRPPQVLQLSQCPRAPVRGVNVHTTELLRTNALIKCCEC